ncbi:MULTISPECIES: tryptophan--tRNA ligase [Desulfitobacterium]|uniref:Tryptophan--tRNA ligase n=2 Tax=Desulfitobacterium dehalogenans TaxID=36854 RepID=I4AB33_DESDJ|nr:MULTISPECIES: tryptophan--tRNA ligase [Desulfitobacterium]AFM01168.1 tryptophanyl-tRNA synthetase [Desulfitobacterium dehalogenans ATCC 51507]HHY26233.1 tryptophan--tRNA ligase [Desulfitobacterium dehalogenans]
MKGRIFSGMRPTGSLHIGHLSVIQNWVKLQSEYQSYFGIVDQHALTTGYEDGLDFGTLIREIALDWLSVGIDPDKSAVFVQSHIKEHAELHLLLSMITPLSWLERVPTYKDQMQQLGKEGGKDISTYGFLGYPLLMAADILVYKADTVPVGEDQIPHVELCREIARRFNHIYGPVFPEPKALIGKVPLLPGVDGRKMSKSYNNTISLTASTEEIKEKVQQMVTDPARLRKDDPGHPEVCVVYKFHEIYTPEVAEVEENCRGGKIGCVACKRHLAENLDKLLSPFRERRAVWEEPGKIEKVLEQGAEQARSVTQVTMKEVRQMMGLK